MFGGKYYVDRSGFLWREGNKVKTYKWNAPIDLRSFWFVVFAHKHMHSTAAHTASLKASLKVYTGSETQNTA